MKMWVTILLEFIFIRPAAHALRTSELHFGKLNYIKQNTFSTSILRKVLKMQEWRVLQIESFLFLMLLKVILPLQL